MSMNWNMHNNVLGSDFLIVLEWNPNISKGLEPFWIRDESMSSIAVSTNYFIVLTEKTFLIQPKI